MKLKHSLPVAMIAVSFACDPVDFVIRYKDRNESIVEITKTQ